MDKSRKNVLLLVYEDEDLNKYLESNALRIMLGTDKYFDFINNEEITNINTNANILKEAAETDSIHELDFSDSFSYEDELNLYKVKESKLLSIIKNYEQTNPDMKVTIQIRKIYTDRISKQR